MQDTKSIERRPFDVSTIPEVEDEIAGLVQSTHDDAGTRSGPLSPARKDVSGGNSGSLASRSANVAEAVQEDAINPTHYRTHPSGIECIEITRHMNFNIGNSIKYLWRYMDKGDPIENLQKAQWYIDDEIRRLKGLR